MSGTIGKRQNGNLLKTRVRDKKKRFHKNVNQIFNGWQQSNQQVRISSIRDNSNIPALMTF